MRWNHLFDDLEGQLEQELRAEERDLAAEEERLRIGRLTLRDRLQSLSEMLGPGASLRFDLGDRTLEVRPTTFGRDWLSGTVVSGAAPGKQCVLPLRSIRALILDQRQVPPSVGNATDSDGPQSLAQRLGLVFVLRDLCRRRAAVEVVVRGTGVHGTIDRVGRDHLDLAVHPSGEYRRSGAVDHIRIVPLDSVDLLML